MAAIPTLRNRLSERIFVLRGAIGGNIMPVTAQVGGNPEGIPSRYEISVNEASPLFPPAISGSKNYSLIRPGLVAPGSMARSSIAPELLAPESRKAPRRLRIPEAPSGEVGSEPAVEPKAHPAPVASKEPDSEVKFQQGNSEKEAYNLLVRSSTSIAGLVQGSNPSLHFISWDAAHKGEDVYWVRLRFQSEGNPGEVDYIWEVKLKTSEVIPLSYNAKSID